MGAVALVCLAGFKIGDGLGTVVCAIEPVRIRLNALGSEVLKLVQAGSNKLAVCVLHGGV